MKVIQLIFLFCAIVSFIVSCRKDTRNCHNNNTINKTDNYIVFGHFHGECRGEHCIDIFKFDDERLFEDKKDKYPGRQQLYEAEFEEIYANKAYESAKQLRQKLPAQLLSEKDTVIGHPDAGDWGGLYIEINENGKRRFWLIDKMQSNVPAYLHPFIDEVNNTIEKLQE